MKVKPSLAPVLAAALALTVAAPCPAEETAGHGAADPGAATGSAWSVSSTVDWANRTLDFTIELELAKAGLRMPSARAEASTLVDHELPGIVRGLALALPVDSRRDLQACVLDGSIGADELLSLAGSAQPGAAAFTKNLRVWRATYRLPIDAAGALLVRHSRAREELPPLEYRPSKAFTGIVIHATGARPVHGERVDSVLEPCLFPRVWDEGMRLLLDRDRVDPAALARWGELSYATAKDPGTEARVGEDPMHVEALAFFGTRVTDILIPREDADRILALPENRALLAAGRVVVIFDNTSPARPASD